MGNVLTGGETAFLVLVLVAFTGFAVVFAVLDVVIDV